MPGRRTGGDCICGHVCYTIPCRVGGCQSGIYPITPAQEFKRKEKIMRNYMVLFAAVAVFSFSACYWASHSRAQGLCTHVGAVCNYPISVTEQCLNGWLSTSIMVTSESGTKNALPMGESHCGWVWWKRLGIPYWQTEIVCGSAANMECY